MDYTSPSLIHAGSSFHKVITGEGIPHTSGHVEHKKSDAKDCQYVAQHYTDPNVLLHFT